MRLKNIVLPVLLLVSAYSFAQKEPGLQRMPNGLEYQIFSRGNGPKVKLNDVVTFNVIEKTDKDSVLSDSYQAGRPARILIQPAKSSIDLMDFFQMLSVKDSAMVKIPSDSLFSDTTRMKRPPFFPKGSALKLFVKIEKVQSEEEVKAEQQKMMDAYKKAMDSLKVNEMTVLNKYIADHSLNVKQTATGLRYIVNQPSAKAKPLSGDSVWVNYTGRTMEGKVFDSSIEATAKQAGLDQPGRTYEPIAFKVGEGEVIKGWDEGLQLMNEGSRATFLIPSDLAYGAQGAGEDIKPFSSLIFDVELVKVKHQKASAAASSPGTGTKMKTPVKKASATGTKTKVTGTSKKKK